MTLKKESALLPPLLLAAYSVLSLYGHNINEVATSEVLPLLGAALMAALVLVIILRIWLKDSVRAGVMATILMGMAFFYGPMFQATDRLMGGHLGHKIFLPVIALATLALAWWLARGPKAEISSRFLLITTLVLLVSPLYQIVDHQRHARDVVLPDPTRLFPVTPTARSIATSHPHVYYLVLDRYADPRTLAKFYGFDNGDFYSQLVERGFLVAPGAFANYTKTAHSLASTLNMTYLDDLARQLGGESADFTPLHSMIKDNRVWRQFQALGYDYIHIGSRWTATRYNPHAKENYNQLPPSGFRELYLDRTVFLALKNRLSGHQTWWERLCSQHHYQFDVLRKLADRPDPFFAFAHVLLPHPPFVFDSTGKCLDPHSRRNRPKKQNYLDQLRYTNQLLLGLIDHIQRQDPESVIILQADEGPYPDRYDQNEEGFDWRQATVEEIQQKFGILLALRAPGMSPRKLPYESSPVNLFRALFNFFYDMDVPLLPDRAFTFIDGRHLYDFIEITDRLKQPLEQPDNDQPVDQSTP